MRAITPTPTVTANGAAIPAIGLGTWPLKGEECRNSVSTALKSGYRHIDTAAMYDNEEAVGEGLKASGVARKDVWITTKVWHENIGEGALQRSAETSVKKLGIEQVDLLLIHWPNKAIPLAQSMKALNAARKAGLARHIGVSNFTTALIGEAVQLSEAPLVANQCEYHPYLDQSKVLAACRKNGMAFISYCPIGRGTAGGVLDEKTVKTIAERHKRTPGQIVLRWHVQQAGDIAVPKSSNPKRIAENLAVFDFKLSAEEMAAISALARPNGRLLNPAQSPAWD